VDPHLDRLIENVSIGYRVRGRRTTNVAFGIECKCLLGVGPDVAVAGIVWSELRRLPYEQHGAVDWGIEVGPDHRTGLSGDAGGLEEVVDDRLHGHVGNGGEAEVGEEVDMR
jgi:hypothetical protein